MATGGSACRGKGSRSTSEGGSVVKQSEGRRWWWYAVLGVIVLLLGFGIGFVVKGSRSDPSTEGLRNDRATQMVQSGEMQAMFDQHKQMLEQMRVDASPKTLQLMDADPMWKLMQTGMYTKMLEDWQKQIDRMLGRGAN
jgi:hypothetical protein